MPDINWRTERSEVLAARARFLAERIGSIIRAESPEGALGLDVGGGEGGVTQRIIYETGFRFLSLDSARADPSSGTDFPRVRGTALRLPFHDETFDVVTLISVYEHIPHPKDRVSSLREVRRVLKRGGLLVGQMPNMNFPIEPHTKLPLIQFLPRPWALAYFRALSPEPAERKRQFGIPWYRVTRPDLEREAREAGFAEGKVWGANLPPESVPSLFRWGYGFTHVMPMNWDFFYRRGTA